MILKTLTNTCLQDRLSSSTRTDYDDAFKGQSLLDTYLVNRVCLACQSSYFRFCKCLWDPSLPLLALACAGSKGLCYPT